MAKQRQCGYCGKWVPEQATQCPFCREELGPVPVIQGAHPESGRVHIRRGLLCMLMASAIHFFAGGYSGIELPLPVLPVVTQYLLPLLFLSGLGLFIYGFYRRFTS